MKPRWLVDACARSKAVYMMAENYLYNRTNALVKNMVDAGLFGEIYYAEGEYLHELSALHHMPDGSPTWRAYWQVGVNGCTYPTHSLGPCLEWVGERVAEGELRRHGSADRSRTCHGGHGAAALQD